MALVLAHRRLGQERYLEFKANLSYVGLSYEFQGNLSHTVSLRQAWATW